MDTSILSQPGLLSHPGFIGGMIGGLIGLFGGIFGALCSYRKAKSIEERRWIVIYTFATIIFCAAFVWALLAVQAPQRIYFQIGFHVVFWPLCIAAIFHLNRLHRNGAA